MSAAKVIDEPSDQAEHKADDDAGDNGKVECGVFGLVGNVSGQTAESKREFAAKVEEGADEEQQAPKNQKSAAKFAKIHDESLAVGTTLEKGRLRRRPPQL